MQGIEIASVAVFSKAISSGVGRHIQALDIESVPDAIEWSFAATCMTFFAGALPKIAVAILLIRIFEPRQLSFWAITILAVIQFLLVVITTVLFYTQCTPHAKAWNPMIEGQCWNPHIFTNWSIFASGELLCILLTGISIRRLLTWHAAFAAFIDLVYGTYPVIVISKLNMRMRKKIGLSLVLAAGLL